jgi:hypothetical protein
MHRPLEPQRRHSSTIDAFMARRALAGLRAGDRVVVQAAEAGQAEALVLRVCAPNVLIRFSRWSEPISVSEGAIPRRLPLDAAA